MGLSAWMLEKFVWEKLVAALVAILHFFTVIIAAGADNGALVIALDPALWLVEQLGKALHAETEEIFLMLVIGKFLTSAWVGVLAYLLLRWRRRNARTRAFPGRIRRRF